jgi:hypothetical protein
VAGVYDLLGSTRWWLNQQVVLIRNRRLLGCRIKTVRGMTECGSAAKVGFAKRFWDLGISIYGRTSLDRMKRVSRFCLGLMAG